MFCSKKIELHTVNTQLPSVLIPREMLADFTQASELIEYAQAQANTLLQQAQAQCEHVMEAAGQQFWQRATPLLQRWESERQAMHDSLEHVATSVINNAIRGLLDETLPAQRVRALLNQLLAAQLPPVRATLLCHPQDRETVERWLACLDDVPWTLRVEHEVSAQSLLLETEDGGFHINWVDALDHLTPSTASLTLK
ncbi:MULTISPECIES: type III secretion system stator protein SctL [Pseudomonas]|uniref:type III secretion system stator protein SctL n=1 Tax=Pseudomonas TaxID=286 RepID=UPI000CFBCF41|nr:MULTISPECIES: type III secretion system stator protein SctL [Pseudomonas]PQZ86625.1 HrpE/YscL family type III secretion apparatus protein [Pseudomonas trivialis]PRB23029.1 HrpE/YscL family type III secretion apparatus protein [Pseudomonas sp. MYb60]